MENSLICPARILLPAEGTDMKKWAALACDQFTSQPEYWAAADAFVGDAPSTLRMILPEVYLEEPDVAARTAAAQAAMAEYEKTLLTRCVNGFVYVERTTPAGTRRGLMAAIDLEAYSYEKGAAPLIRPTEGTVPERIPPRLQVRRAAPLELPHILMLLDDPARTVLEPLAAMKADLPLLYDTDLMLEGGHIAGWAVEDAALIESLCAAVNAFAEKPGPGGRPPIAIAVGDGNHSLATAKAHWEELKAALPAERLAGHPARYALAEIENIHDEAILMEPIHRAVFGADADALAADMRAFFAAHKGEQPPQTFTLVRPDGEERPFAIPRPAQPLCVGSVEAFFAAWLPAHPEARVDYIHGADAVHQLAGQGTVGMILPDFEKDDLFRGVYLGGVLPKKTFSMGHATEKRYYMEARRIRG